MAITRTAWTDDSGGGTDGTIINNAVKTELYDQIDGRWSEVSITSTGSQNNVSITEGDEIRLNNASLLTITGIVAPASPAKPGKPIRLISVGAGQVDLVNQSGSSTDVNRIITGVTGTISLAPGTGRATLVYDDTTNRWRVIQHEQGDELTATFAAGNFTSTGTWTVAAGDVTTMTYYLRGNQLTVKWYIVTTSVSGTPASLSIGSGAYGGFTWQETTIRPCLGQNAGGGNEMCYANTAASGGNIAITQVDGGTWSNATDTTAVFGELTCGVT